MDTVINSLRLALFILAAFIYLAGLGWLITGVLLHGNLTRRRRETPKFQELALMLTNVIILNYTLPSTLLALGSERLSQNSPRGPGL